MSGDKIERKSKSKRERERVEKEVGRAEERP